MAGVAECLHETALGVTFADTLQLLSESPGLQPPRGRLAMPLLQRRGPLPALASPGSPCGSEEVFCPGLPLTNGPGVSVPTAPKSNAFQLHGSRLAFPSGFGIWENPEVGKERKRGNEVEGRSCSPSNCSPPNENRLRTLQETPGVTSSPKPRARSVSGGAQGLEDSASGAGALRPQSSTDFALVGGEKGRRNEGATESP